MIYALTLTLCLLDGKCYDTMPESYTTMQECEVEAIHQITQGLPKEFVSCTKIKTVFEENYLYKATAQG